MALTVRTNVAAGSALNQLNNTSRALSRSFERISTGRRIARAADDAAGLGVAENLRGAASSAAVAARNAGDGISMIAVAEGASSEVASILTRMRELAIQGSSETLATAERAYVEDERASLELEIDRISAATEFNGQFLTNGSLTSVAVQVGISDDVLASQIEITLGNLAATALGIDAIDMSTASGALDAISDIDAAISEVSTNRSAYGAAENRLTSALENLGVFETTTLEAESRIRDADFGAETAELSSNQILQQAGVSILAQANQINQSVMSLLQ